MKKLLVIIVCGLLLTACGNQKWEYKIVRVEAESNALYAYFNGGEDLGANTFADQTAMLNFLGADGWELVDVYTEVSTSFPNLSAGKYVTGIKPNTKTAVLNFVLKRPYSGKSDSDTSEAVDMDSERLGTVAADTCVVDTCYL